MAATDGHRARGVGQGQTVDDGKNDELEWIKVQDMLSEAKTKDTKMGLKEKMIFKTSENVLVPIGILATTAVLACGLWSMKKGDARKSQTMMRARVVAQGLTVAAMTIGYFVAAARTPKTTS